MSLSVFILEVCSVAVFQHKLLAVWFGKLTSKIWLGSVLAQCHLTADCLNPQPPSDDNTGRRSTACYSHCGAC